MFTASVESFPGNSEYVRKIVGVTVIVVKGEERLHARVSHTAAIPCLHTKSQDSSYGLSFVSTSSEPHEEGLEDLWPYVGLRADTSRRGD